MDFLRMYDTGYETRTTASMDVSDTTVCGGQYTASIVVRSLADFWRMQAEDIDPDGVARSEDELGGALAEQSVYMFNKMAAELEDAFGLIDTKSSASRQHYIDTGRYLRKSEQ